MRYQGEPRSLDAVQAMTVVVYAKHWKPTGEVFAALERAGKRPHRSFWHGQQAKVAGPEEFGEFVLRQRAVNVNELVGLRECRQWGHEIPFAHEQHVHFKTLQACFLGQHGTGEHPSVPVQSSVIHHGRRRPFCLRLEQLEIDTRLKHGAVGESCLLSNEGLMCL